MILNLISVVGTALTLVSLWLYIWSGRLVAPRLILEVGSKAGPTAYPWGTAAWVHVQVRNLPPTGWEDRLLRFLRTPRRAAANATATIIYRDVSTRAVVLSVPARWSGQVEPYNYVARAFDPALVAIGYSRNILSGPNPEPIPIAVKYEGVAESWAFTQQSYSPGSNQFERRPWTPDTLRLPRGEYEVTVEVNSENDRLTRIFRLSITGPTLSDADFNLRPA